MCYGTVPPTFNTLPSLPTTHTQTSGFCSKLSRQTPTICLSKLYEVIHVRRAWILTNHWRNELTEDVWSDRNNTEDCTATSKPSWFDIFLKTRVCVWVGNLLIKGTMVHPSNLGTGLPCPSQSGSGSVDSRSFLSRHTMEFGHYYSSVMITVHKCSL